MKEGNEERNQYEGLCEEGLEERRKCLPLGGAMVGAMSGGKKLARVEKGKVGGNELGEPACGKVFAAQVACWRHVTS